MTSLTEENGRRSGKNLKVVQFEDLRITQETKPILRYSRSVSFSTSDSSRESGLIDHDLPIEDKDGEHIIDLQTPALSPDEGIICPSPVWSFLGFSSSDKQSPPIQNMNHPAGYDPNRIPASVFSKPNTEWSLASNESLFSIHPGNSSFSRDHVFLFSKSGEVSKYEDLISIPNTLSAGGDINEIKNSQVEKQAGVAEKLETYPMIDVEDFAGPNQSSDGSSVKISEVTDNSAKNAQMDVEKSSALDEMSAESPKLCGEESGMRGNLSEPSKSVVKQIQEEKVQDKITPTEEVRESTSASYRSESSTSTHSFHFPVLAVENGRASSVTVESEKHSVQLQPPQLPQPQLQQQEMPQEEELRPEKLQTHENVAKSPKHERTSWFSCFSCRPCCCC